MEIVVKTKEQILKECEIETLLKRYLNTMISVVGEDYTLATFLEMGNDIASSLSFYSENFKGITNQEVMAALLKGILLSRKTSNNLDRIKKAAMNYNPDRSISIAFSNRNYRIEIIKTYMSQCETSNNELFECLNKRKSGVLSAIISLNDLMNSFHKEEPKDTQVQQKKK